MSKQNTPRISVIIPYTTTYEKYLDEAKNSVINAHETILVPYTENLCKARNRGVKEATGDYILQLDADDILEPTFIEECTPLLEEKTIVATGHSEFGEVTGEYTVEDDLSLENFKRGNRILGCSVYPLKMWEEVGGYDETLEGYEDWDFWLRALEAGYTIKKIDKPLVRIRIHKTSRNKEAIKNHDRLKNYILNKCKPIS